MALWGMGVSEDDLKLIGRGSIIRTVLGKFKIGEIVGMLREMINSEESEQKVGPESGSLIRNLFSELDPVDREVIEEFLAESSSSSRPSNTNQKPDPLKSKLISFLKHTIFCPCKTLLFRRTTLLKHGCLHTYAPNEENLYVNNLYASKPWHYDRIGHFSWRDGNTTYLKRRRTDGPGGWSWIERQKRGTLLPSGGTEDTPGDKQMEICVGERGEGVFG